MIDTGQPNAAAVELIRPVQNTDAFLKMAAIELRQIAELAPDIAAELRHMANQLEAESASRLTFYQRCGAVGSA
ncbi:MAG: hypothetical protein JO204_13520 [Alphaproteobacteria bacterium]|nr:hypothetical protein [Alphaproteobacteria bacterium]